ncbi:MAG: OPT family oligopeptide transporter [Janthinobacterium lividum]
MTTPASRHVELTLRGMLLGAAITVVFMAANIYMGLKTGITFSSSIPAAVISMALLRAMGGGSILENNMVQTQASAAGTLCNVILVLPALIMIGHWQHFAFWQTTGVCLLGGLLGVMYSIPLRRAMVIDSGLPFPEGVAAAEVLRLGAGAEAGQDEQDAARDGTRALVGGGVAAAVFSLGVNGLRLVGDGMSWTATAGHAVFRIGTGFSLALLGVGYLVGIAACLSLVLGVAIAWGVAVPLLTALDPAPHAGSASDAAMAAWSGRVRLIGAGVIATGSVWCVLTLVRPMASSIRDALASARVGHGGAGLPRQEQDLPIAWVGAATLALSLPLAGLLAWFALPAEPALGMAAFAALIVGATVFTMAFGFLMATACGYMAGLLGSSSSPISGIGILGTIVVSLLFGAILGHVGGDPAASGRFAVALALFLTAVVVTVSSIANDNLQDLKTGQIVDATPWRQQVALLAGVAVGAIVIAPLLDLLYQTYGFPGAMPRPGMDPARALAAPQASLMAVIGNGIVSGQLAWGMVAVGVALGACLVAVDELLQRRFDAQLPVLTVGIGIYLPPTVGLTIAVGGILEWLTRRHLRAAPEATRESARRRGVLLASGFLVGESVAGMILATVEGAAGHSFPLAVVGPGFAGTAAWIGLAGFSAAAVVLYRLVVRTR